MITNNIPAGLGCPLQPEDFVAYLSGALNIAAYRQVEHHVAGCARCQQRLEQAEGEGAELTCRQLVELVTDYIEGRLDAAERARFEGHLAGCEECRAYILQMRQTIRLLRTLLPAPLSPARRAELLRLVHSWHTCTIRRSS